MYIILSKIITDLIIIYLVLEDMLNLHNTLTQLQVTLEI